MGFLRRVRNIVSANLHELLERCENPELLLNQAIRAMEEALRSALTGAAKVVAHERLLIRQRDQALVEAGAARRQAEAAVAADNDNLAYQALRRQRDQQTLAEVLSVSAVHAAAASGKLRRQIEAMRLQLDEARRQRNLLIARQRSALARRQLLAVLGDLPGDTAVGHDFDRLARKVEQMEAETDAWAEVTGLSSIDLPAATDSETDAWVKHELERLKHPG